MNVGDAIFLIAYVFTGGDAPDPLEAGDANCEGQVNVGDAVYLIAYVFCGGDELCCPLPWELVALIRSYNEPEQKTTRRE